MWRKIYLFLWLEWHFFRAARKARAYAKKNFLCGSFAMGLLDSRTGQVILRLIQVGNPPLTVSDSGGRYSPMGIVLAKLMAVLTHDNPSGPEGTIVEGLSNYRGGLRYSGPKPYNCRVGAAFSGGTEDEDLSLVRAAL